MRESILSPDKQRNAAARRVIGWQKEIETRRQLHLATLKEMRHEWNALEKRLREIIDGDQLELFPGADVRQPKCLMDTETLWTLLIEKDLTLRLFRVEVPGEEPMFFMDAIFRSDGPLAKDLPARITRYVAGEKAQAALNAVLACEDQLTHTGAPREANLRRALAKLKKDAPPPIPAIDPTRVLPTVGTHQCAALTKEGSIGIEPGSTLASSENPDVKPDVFFKEGAADDLYVAVSQFGGEGRSCFLDTAAVRVVPVK